LGYGVLIFLREEVLVVVAAETDSFGIEEEIHP
jgi:hypothetical protein